LIFNHLSSLFTAAPVFRKSILVSGNCKRVPFVIRRGDSVFIFAITSLMSQLQKLAGCHSRAGGNPVFLIFSNSLQPDISSEIKLSNFLHF